MTKPVLPFVETMITQVCNLSCLGCTNYSDLVQQGYVPWATGKQWLTDWLERIDIPDFGIMGGEPLINPEVYQWLEGVRKLMPNTQIRFTTNGSLLDRHPDILERCHDLGNIVFKISVHEKSHKLESIIDEVKYKFKWERVHEYGITRWKTTNDLRFQVNRPNNFVKSYRGNYHNMAPYSSNPKESFSICCQQTCPLLWDGKLFKCSTSGLLEDTLNKVGKPNWEQWQPYLQKGISPTSSDKELANFIDNFGKAESVCKMCPTLRDMDAIIDHYATVKTIKVKHVP